MDNEWTPNEVIMIAKNIYKIYTAGVLNKDKYIISEVSKKDGELFSALGVDLYYVISSAFEFQNITDKCFSRL